MESVIFLLLLAISGGHPQQLDFLKLPPSLQLNTAHHKLATNEIEALITNILGIPSDMHWQGLRRQPAFEYPKANLLFVVEGFDSPSDLGFDCQKWIKVNPDILQVHSINFDSLISSIKANFDKPPLLLQAHLLPVENVAGALATSRAFSANFLDVSRAADFRFFAELSSIDSKFKELDLGSRISDELRPFVVDSTPDVITCLFLTPNDVIAAYGATSLEVKEMKLILAKFIKEASSLVSSLYKDKIAIELLTMPSVPKHSGSHVRHERSATAGKENVTVTSPNLAASYNEDYAAIFNIAIWTSLVLVIGLYGIVYGFWNIDPGTDGIIYRMTTMKTR